MASPWAVERTAFSTLSGGWAGFSAAWQCWPCAYSRELLAGREAAAAGKAPAGSVRRATATAPLKTPAGDPASPGRPDGARKQPVVAVVNDEPISREDLARECLLHYGQEVLESMVNRTLILASCQQRNIMITDKQIDDEIDRMARKFAWPRINGSRC